MEPHPTDALVEAIAAWCDKATDVAGVAPSVDPTALYPWKRDGEYLRLEYQSEDLAPLFRAHEKLVELNEYATATDALGADPAVGPHVGKLVGDPLGQSLLDPERMLFGILLRAAPQADRREAIRIRIQEVRRFLSADRVERRVVAPLPSGFRPTLVSPIVLDGRTRLASLNDVDIAMVLHLGHRFRDLPDPAPLVHVGDPWAIEVSYELPLISHTSEEEVPRQAIDAAFQAQKEAGLHVTRVIEALRLAKAGKISVIGILHVDDNDILGGRGVQFTSVRLPRPPFDAYDLNEDDVPPLRTLLSLVSASVVLASPALQTTVRRFSSSIERHDPEDRLVDLIVSAEALFAGDTQPGDLSLRIAQRFARYVHVADGPDLMSLFAHMKTAYGGRSKIVHAQRRTTAVQRQIDRALEGADLMESLMRDAIQQALADADERGEFAIDWDRLVLEGP